MKLNWSQILIIAMGLFIVFIVSLGIRMARSTSELYEKDYYSKGEKHAERMIKEQTAQAIDIHYDARERAIVLVSQGKGIGVSTIKSVYLSNMERDFVLRMDSTARDSLRIPIALQSGDWMLEISGDLDGAPFFKKMEVRP